jgi:nucleoside-diphosphate-sugar epimerase
MKWPIHAFTERDLPRPQDAYSISKLEAERRLVDVCAGSVLGLTVLRPPLVYGPGVKGNLRTLIRAIERGIPLPLGAVDNRRTLIGIDNLVHAIRLCLDHPLAAGGMFLVGDERAVSTIELARTIGQAMGKPARLLPISPRLLRLAGTLLCKSAAVARLTSSLVVDSSAIRERLGWRPIRSFDDGIRDMVTGHFDGSD